MSSSESHPKPSFHRPHGSDDGYDSGATGLGTPPTWLADSAGGVAGPTGATGAAGAAGATGATGPAGPGLPVGTSLQRGRVTGISIAVFSTTSGTVTYSPAFGAAPALVIFPDANGDTHWDRVVHVDSGTNSSFTWVCSTGSSGVAGVLFSWIAVG